jgi:crotonobetainyl-CoA:carnitine CoA-transferase CaiB-like acyl-CoA transferase
VALLDSIMPLMGWVAANLLIGHQQPVLMGNDNFTAAPSGTFATADGCVNIAANQQKQWEDLAKALGVPELVEDPRFKERDTRKANRKLLTPLLEEKLRQQTTAHWVEVLNAVDVPTGAVIGLEEALLQEQCKHRQTLQPMNVEGIGELPFFSLTAKFSATPGALETAPPRLSQHTAEILGTLGYSEADIQALKEKGVV